MNSNIRSVIRLKSLSIKLLWLLIYNLYATERFTFMVADFFIQGKSWNDDLLMIKFRNDIPPLLHFPRHTALFYTCRSDSSQEKTVITAANRHAWIARSSRTMTTLNIFVCLRINCSERFSPRVLSMRLACLSGGRSATFLRSGEIPARIFFSNKKKDRLALSQAGR